jgi:hypothetical protein
MQSYSEETAHLSNSTVTSFAWPEPYVSENEELAH